MCFTASAGYVRGLPQIYKQMSEIGKVYFDISLRVQYIFGVFLKYTNKRAR